MLLRDETVHIMLLSMRLTSLLTDDALLLLRVE
jgi:hypothetical protein